MAANILSLLTEQDSTKFHQKVFKRPDGCWEWCGYRTKTGYGQMNVRGTVLYAHRVSHALHYRVDPGLLHVCHSCDRPWCVNPEHLWLGTQRQNMADMAHKQRASAGERRPAAKLCPDDVHAIRDCLAAGMKVTSIARQFKISQRVVSGIKSGELWRSVSPGQ